MQMYNLFHKSAELLPVQQSVAHRLIVEASAVQKQDRFVVDRIVTSYSEMKAKYIFFVKIAIFLLPTWLWISQSELQFQAKGMDYGVKYRRYKVCK